jgi:hypothetical protein
MSKENPENPFSLDGARREDIWVVTYTCPKGHDFDLFVPHANLVRVGVTQCPTHPESQATIHQSRQVR